MSEPHSFIETNKQHEKRISRTLTREDVSKWYFHTRFACVQIGSASSWRCRQDCRQWMTGTTEVAGNRPVMPALTEKGEAYERAVAAFPAWRYRRDERHLHPSYRVGVECGRADGPCRHDDRHLSRPQELPGTTGRSRERGQRLRRHPLRPGADRHIALETAPGAQSWPRIDRRRNLRQHLPAGTGNRFRGLPVPQCLCSVRRQREVQAAGFHMDSRRRAHQRRRV